MSITSTEAITFHLLFSLFVFFTVHWYPLLPLSIIDLIYFLLSRWFFSSVQFHTHARTVWISCLIWSSMSLYMETIPINSIYCFDSFKNEKFYNKNNKHALFWWHSFRKTSEQLKWKWANDIKFNDNITDSSHFEVQSYWPKSEEQRAKEKINSKTTAEHPFGLFWPKIVNQSFFLMAKKRNSRWHLNRFSFMGNIPVSDQLSWPT